MFKECRHIHPDGSRCHAAALSDLPYCYQHDRIHRALLRQKSSAKARLALPALEDRSSILVALTQVINAIADGRLDHARAGRIIYALQIAAQLAPAFPRSASDEQVDSITRTREGEDLAPLSIKCFKGDDCSTCPYTDECDCVGENNAGDSESEDEPDNDTEETAVESANNEDHRGKSAPDRKSKPKRKSTQELIDTLQVLTSFEKAINDFPNHPS